MSTSYPVACFGNCRIEKNDKYIVRDNNFWVLFIKFFRLLNKARKTQLRTCVFLDPSWFMLPIKTKMVVDMELQEAKDAVLQLMKDKEKIESNLQALKEILDSVCIV